ncbi:MAG: site-specific recombinase, invertase Pin, partial [Pseudonocardia sp.]|nr:site-specific recombinase, invertase Pin [Pseudonocardia sp.]
MRAVIYLRQSKDREGNELAIERQRSECRRLCDSRGWTVAEEIVENNRSASKAGRPGFKQVIGMLERQVADGVVVLRIDRLFRLNDELETLINLSEAHGGRVVTVEGDIDLATPSGRLVARVLVSVARAEMETKSARHKLANKQRAEAGVPHSSKRPYGYNPDRLTLHPVEGPVVRRMGEMILSGHSYRGVAYWLNGNGHLSTGGYEWNKLTVRKLLENPRYGGIRRLDDQDYAGKWEPVFDRATWQRLQTVMAARRTGSPGDGSPAYAKKYLLT